MTMATPDKRRRRLLTVLVLVLVALIGGAAGIATVLTDWWWFDALGQGDVFTTMLASQWVTGAAFAFPTFLLLYVNALIARRLAPRAVLRPVAAGGAGPEFDEALRRLREQTEPFLGPAILGGAAFLAIAIGAGIAPSWDAFRLALAAQPFGAVDPQFGRDIGFYVFSLPALRIVANWLFSTLLLTLATTAVVHLLGGAIDLRARVDRFAPHVKAHLSVLGGLVLASKALDYWLQVYELNFSPRGQVLGASYTDVYAQLPALRILFVIALVSAAVLLVNIRQRGWRLPAVALGVWIAASFLVGQVYPALVQQFRVDPNEVAVESPFIERNIAATREAFQLDDVEVEAFPASESLTAEDLRNNVGTLDNVRLWDPNLVVQSYKQLQEIRFYYDFDDVDIDRYTIDGEYRQVLISAREMNVDELSETAQTWVNRHLAYTHGYGAVVSPVNLSTTDGFPRFIVKDLPPATDTNLVIDEPRIYYGEQTYEYVLAPSDFEEFDYPIGEDKATNNYDGAGGVPVDSLLRQVVFALRFSSAKIVLSEYVTEDSKMLFRRSIRERASALAPWLALDDDPYITIVDGRLLWVLDGYTTSSMYPYSERMGPGGLNYLRNSVKITIDAHDGTTTLYAFDEEDPILATWREVFPGLVVDDDEMPEEVRSHLRYPEDLFRVQAEVYKTYHMLEPTTFYNKEDQWELPGEDSASGAMTPYYVLMRLPGEDSEEFMLMQPFTPRNKQNMIGWMAARSDPEVYGRRLVYTFPKQRLVQGPDQVIARINQDPTISQQLSLWNQRGSQALFGNMLVIPLEESLVFIQPLYLQAEQTAIPQLTRVIVSFADRVAMEADLATALEEVFGVPVPEDVEGGAGPAVVDGTGEDTGEEPLVNAARADELYRSALEAQRAGDWAEYGRLMEELGEVLSALVGPSAEATGAP
jgi:uncharacterized membrane protein (UPF0182 family)